MLSSALNKLTSNIVSNYHIASQPSTIAGPWKVFDGKHRVTKKQVSIFIFERRTLEPSIVGIGISQNRNGGLPLRKAQDEVVERLRKEASVLAKLRHPSILELVEPVEDTRHHGLMFATELVTTSLASFMEEQDEYEDQTHPPARRTRSIGQPNGTASEKSSLSLDELEIQKGLLQVGKGLEFLHNSAGLVHANLNPDAIFMNIKSDWKISGLGFCSPPTQTSRPTSFIPISLAEVLNHDPRLPRSVQLNLDFSSPDFVFDSTIASSADMFSLGLIIIAMYNRPHKSPIETNQSTSGYKRILSSPSTVPTVNNNFKVTQKLPNDMRSEILPRLITRRPANRFEAGDFQQARYFDNILVSTIRFLDNLPAKSANEKLQFLRGLTRILPQFPIAVLEKKVLPALLQECKDSDLLPLILVNSFAIVKVASDGHQIFAERLIPKLREVFLANSKLRTGQERDVSKEAGLLAIIDNMETVIQHCNGQDFKDNILPIVYQAFESSTVSLVEAALTEMSLFIPVLDFSTIRNGLFPAVATVFSRTSSMAIKVRSLRSLCVLCGGTSQSGVDAKHDFAGIASSNSSSTVLDKHTIQEKIVPLLKGIKTKEPAVMLAARDVFKQVGIVADAEFLAHEVLPTLWVFALGPLLNLAQFTSFMTLIRSISDKVEEEQTRKLRILAPGAASERGGGHAGSAATLKVNDSLEAGEMDFETLVTGRRTIGELDVFDAGWAGTSASTASRGINGVLVPGTSNISGQDLARGSDLTSTIMPDTNLRAFSTLQPGVSNLRQNGTQPITKASTDWRSSQTSQAKPVPSPGSIDWSAAANTKSSSTSSNTSPPSQHLSSLNFGATTRQASHPFANNIKANVNGQSSSLGPLQSFQTNSRPTNTGGGLQSTNSGMMNTLQQGLEKYESLI